MDRNKNESYVWIVLPGRACIRIFNAKVAVSGNAFECSKPILWRIMSAKFTKMVHGVSRATSGFPFDQWLCCLSGRASVYIEGPNPLTWDGIYQLFCSG
jgi:hypothetical protein